MKKEKSTYSIGEVLDEYFSKNREVGYRIKSLEAIKKWDTVVNDYIKRHTKPVQIKDRILFVNADSAVLANELSLREQELRTKLNHTLKFPIIEKIIFRSGSVRKNDKKEEKAKKISHNINIRTLNLIDKTVEKIKESDLREIIKKFLISSAMRNKGK